MRDGIVKSALKNPNVLDELRAEFHKPPKSVNGIPVERKQYSDNQLLDIMAWRLSGATEFIDDDGDIFPVHKDDTIKSILDRYFNLYPIEANGFLAGMHQKLGNQNAENGMSRDGNMRYVGTVPNKVYYAIQYIDGDAWRGLNRNITYEKLKAEAPKFFTKGRMR
jgi:hypothetical protein